MADYKTREDRCCEEIDAARKAVERAHRAYARGGSADAVNEAEGKLADAHAELDRCRGGRVR
jgi:hypothetical protein